MKTLITWIGFNEDFLEKGHSVNPEGFTGNIHRDIYESYHFSKHIVLSSIDRSGELNRPIANRKLMLQRHIKTTYPTHVFEIKDIEIDKEDLQNFQVIELQLRSFISSFDATEELHVIAGTGPTAVGMAWASLNIGMANAFSLHLMKRAEHTSDGIHAELVDVIPYVNHWLDNKLREHHFSYEVPNDIFQDSIVVKEYERAKKIAPATDVNVLILGETGCGKDKLAEFIVTQSPLNKAKYKAINCASLPDELLYSELFGHAKGAFTGASSERKGLFEECNGGTLFLDEIGDISPFMQQALLRVIENKEIKKAGSNQIQKDISVRILAATNHDLYAKCKQGHFRFDLYYRLNGMEIELSNYRNRTESERLAVRNYYIDKLSAKWGRKLILSDNAEKVLSRYSFPGNFREIYNSLNTIYALDIPEVREEDLPTRFRGNQIFLSENYEEVMMQHCIFIYQKYNYNITATCKALGYKNSTQLKNKLQQWGALKEVTSLKNTI